MKKNLRKLLYKPIEKVGTLSYLKYQFIQRLPKEPMCELYIIYNHTPYIRAHKLSINPTIQNSFTISFSFQPNLSK